MRINSFWYVLKRDYISKWQLYLFLLLPIVYIIIFAYVPMGGVQIAFRKYNFIQGIWDSPWVGFRNFERFFSAYNFSSIFGNTLKLALYNLIAGFPLPILLALIINSFPGQRYKKLVQTVSYMPHFISTVVIVGMLIQIFNPRTGGISAIMQMLTGEMLGTDLLSKPSTFPHMYVWSGSGRAWAGAVSCISRRWLVWMLNCMRPRR